MPGLTVKWECPEALPLSQRPTQPPPPVEKKAPVTPSAVRKRVPFSGAYSFIYEEPPVEKTGR